MATLISGVLEVDHERGVIYFHINPNIVNQYGVVTALRICSLPKPIPKIKERMLDITHMVGADWKGK